jgi:hypothetical protein
MVVGAAASPDQAPPGYRSRGCGPHSGAALPLGVYNAYAWRPFGIARFVFFLLVEVIRFLVLFEVGGETDESRGSTFPQVFERYPARAAQDKKIGK